jgi:glycosyltransferase involved in cell wall biosynthesis
VANRVILFVSESLDASPTRYRATAFFDRLRCHGWEPRHMAVVGAWRRLALLNAVREAHVVVVLRKFFSPVFCRLLRNKNRRLILDLDDALFADENGTRSPSRERWFAGMARYVNAVWAGNDYLAQAALPYCPKTTVLPTSVETSKYDQRIDPSGDCFDVVWIGSSSTRKYLEALLPILGRAAKEIPGLRLKIIADFDLPAAGHLGVPTVAVPWSSLSEARDLASSHVGVAYMPDDPWTRGKCGLKVLQYMAAGLPVIASATGVHREIVVDGQTGFLASDEAGWLAALRQLRFAASMRRLMGDAGRQRVMERYSASATFDKMLASLETLTGPDDSIR